MKFFLLLFCIVFCKTLIAQVNPDAILGKWKTDKGNCIVEVFKLKNQYNARVLWFDVKNKKPMNEWLDEKNPDPKLRTRKLLGMEVVEHLRFDGKSNQWVDGIIYDATTGKKWDSIVWLTKDNQLKVKGYWIFKFFSQTKTFLRVS